MVLDKRALDCGSKSFPQSPGSSEQSYKSTPFPENCWCRPDRAVSGPASLPQFVRVCDLGNSESFLKLDEQTNQTRVRRLNSSLVRVRSESEKDSKSRAEVRLSLRVPPRLAEQNQFCQPIRRCILQLRLDHLLE
jgi:hypothetical protein